MIKTLVRPAMMVLLALSAICGLLYPLVVTILAQTAFPEKANGSLIAMDGEIKGSLLIGQPFRDPKYFWGRPSSTSPAPYDASSSLASNFAPSNPALTDRVRASISLLKNSDPSNTQPIPVDLVTSSGSGLDPHISVAAAEWQLQRIGRIRGLTVGSLQKLLGRQTEARQLGVLGEPRVNVLKLNLALDELSRQEGAN